MTKFNQGFEGVHHQFFPHLFALLQEAMNQQDSPSEDEGDLDYSVDLLLNVIHSLVDEMSASITELDKSTFNPELLVHCVRRCKSPSAKNVALLTLAKLSAFSADYVFQNAISIFTFMGDHYLKLDSKRSFEVACDAIDIIVPHILKTAEAKGGANAARDMGLSVITTFVDASADMPIHRYKRFLSGKLSLTLSYSRLGFYFDLITF